MTDTQAHRDTDVRFCSARTIVIGQNNVFVNGLLWAVEGDPEDHGNGELVAVYGAKNIYINNKHVIVAIGDHALADNHPHEPPLTHPLGRSPNVYVY